MIYRPKDVVLGDFYWLNTIDNQCVFIEADCIGHGVSGAFMTLIGSAIFDNSIIIKNLTNPTEILYDVHTQFNEVLRQEDRENRVGMDLSIVIIENQVNSCHIKFGSAGQRLYFAKERELDMLQGSRKKVEGYSNPKKVFEAHAPKLNKGEVLYLSSDGFIDQNNENRRRFGSANFENLLNTIKMLSMPDQKQKLVEALDNHQQNCEQRDDITVIGLKL